MNRSNNKTLALLSAVTIGLVNIASLSVVYIVFHDAHKPTESAVAQTQSTAGTPSSGTSTTEDTAGATGQTGTPAGSSNGLAGGTTQSVAGSTPSTTGSSKPGGTSSGSSGSSATKSSGSPSSTSGSSAGSSSGSSGSISSGGTTTSPPPAAPNSLAKGSPCTTQIPPAGVCTAVLSFNNQKDGNPYWDPTLLADIKQGIASDSFVQLLGLSPTTIYNGMTVTIKESTWSGSATHGTIQGTMSAEGQSQATTFTLDWSGSKWIVDDAAEN